MWRSRYRWLAGLVLALAFVAVACAGPDEDGSGPSSGVGPGISVEEALGSPSDEPLLVNGFIVATPEGVRLCSALAESFPPQCAGPSLVVEGLDLKVLPGLSRANDVTWSEREVQVLGRVRDSTLTVEGAATA